MSAQNSKKLALNTITAGLCRLLSTELTHVQNSSDIMNEYTITLIAEADIRLRDLEPQMMD